MAVTYSDFVAAFPEFVNGTTYPQTQIEFWLTSAYSRLNAGRFGAQLDLAAMLYAAHYVSLAAKQAKAASRGQVVGAQAGMLTSKSVGGVSAGYSDNTSIQGAGIWNATTYGQQLYQMMRVASAGPNYFPGPRRYFGPGQWWGH